MSNSDAIAAAVERHAEAILRASGSSLSNYTMPANRKAILSAVMDCYEQAYRDGASFGGKEQRGIITRWLRGLHWTHRNYDAAQSFAKAIEEGASND